MGRGPRWAAPPCDRPSSRITPYFKVFIDVARVGTKHFPSLPITNDYRKAINAAYNDAMAGNKVPRAALDEVTQTMQAQLNQALS
jgi:maltose-binding protein MalE